MKVWDGWFFVLGSSYFGALGLHELFSPSPSLRFVT